MEKRYLVLWTGIKRKVGICFMERYRHIVENELTHEVVFKGDFADIRKDLEEFVDGLPVDAVYSLTIIDKLTRETIYYVR